MKKAVKLTALLFTSALLLAACGQNKKEDTTVATTTQATTDTPTTTYTLEDAKKAVFEISDRVGTITMTFYYKDDVLLKEEKVSTFIISKVAGDNPLEMLKKAAGETKEKLKVFIGKGVEYNTDYKDDVFTITNSYDYTKLDMQKLKEVYPNLNLRDDKTLSYSEFKEALLKGGYKEKQ